MKIRELSQSKLVSYATARGYSAPVAIHGHPTNLSPHTPLLLLFRTETEILHASVYWQGDPFSAAVELAPQFREGRKDFVHEVYEYSGDSVRLVPHDQATKSYRLRADLGGGWYEMFGMRYISHGGKAIT